MSSLKPKVSVLVPTYNRSHLLKKTLDSIFQQSFTDFEVVVVDNNSTDGTPQVIESFDDKRLIYVRNEVNIGAVYNYNKALRLARGEYVYLFSDDDRMTDVDNLKLKVAILDAYPSVGVVHANYDVIDEDGNRIGENLIATKPIWQKIHPVPLLQKEQAFPLIFAGHSFISMTSVLLRNSVLIENHLEFNNQLRYAVDWNLWLHMSLFCDFYYLDKILTSHLRHDSNESLSANSAIYYKEALLAKIGLLTLFGHTGKIPYKTVDEIIKKSPNPDSIANKIIYNFGRVQRLVRRVLTKD